MQLLLTKNIYKKKNIKVRKFLPNPLLLLGSLMKKKSKIIVNLLPLIVFNREK